MDEDREYEFTIRVRSFGDPQLQERTLRLRLARAVHHRMTPHFVLVDGDGNQWRFDPLADDMGNHPGHDAALVPVVEGSA